MTAYPGRTRCLPFLLFVAFLAFGCSAPKTQEFTQHPAMKEGKAKWVVQPVPHESVTNQPFSSVSLVRGTRSPGARDTATARYGGAGSTEGAVLRALRWLKEQQSPDGSWGGKNECKTAATSLALVTFSAHGETPASEEFGTTVRKGLDYLGKAQEPDGHFQTTTNTPALEHALAT